MKTFIAYFRAFAAAVPLIGRLFRKPAPSFEQAADALLSAIEMLGAVENDCVCRVDSAKADRVAAEIAERKAIDDLSQAARVKKNLEGVVYG